MIREPKIPMLPTELPQQRIHEVVSLPARPTEFSSFVHYGDMPEGTVSKNPPRNAIYLCQVECDPPPLSWSTLIVSKGGPNNGHQETSSGRDCYKITPG